MSLPETCPFCGSEPYTTASGEQCRGGDSWVLFSCDTSIYAGQDLRRTQSRKCEVSERDRLFARVADLEARCKRLEEAGDALERDKQTFKKMLADLGVVGSMGFGSAVKWAQAKEAKQ